MCYARWTGPRRAVISTPPPGTSKKMLAHHLRQLEADGIVLRRDMSDIVLHVEYDFTSEAREDVCSLLDHLAQWGRMYALSQAILSTSEKPHIILKTFRICWTLSCTQVWKKQIGEGPEEELDSGTQPSSGGRSRAKRVQGETARVPLPILGTKRGTAMSPLKGESCWWFMQLSRSAWQRPGASSLLSPSQ